MYERPDQDDIDAWKDFCARHEVEPYVPGEPELAFLEALADAVTVHGIYSVHATLRKAFDAGVLRGQMEGIAFARKIFGGK